MQLYLVCALVFSLIVAIFALQNTEVVIVKFLTFQFSISLVLVILGSAVVGAFSLYFLGLFKQVGSWFKNRQLNNRKEELEKQVKELETKLGSLEKKDIDSSQEDISKDSVKKEEKPEQEVAAAGAEDNSEIVGEPQENRGEEEAL